MDNSPFFTHYTRSSISFRYSSVHHSELFSGVCDLQKQTFEEDNHKYFYIKLGYFQRFNGDLCYAAQPGELHPTGLEYRFSALQGTSKSSFL